MPSVEHFDRVEAPKWMTTAFTKTPEGFLKGRAVVTTTGIFEYMDARGNIVRELRLPEEVYKAEFLDSLKLKPVTVEHPKEMLNADNVKKYAVGTMGNNPSDPWDGNTDNYNLSIDMIIHDSSAIKEVLAGKRQLSVGYSCDLEDAEPGSMWCGQRYDKIQRNLIANHVSIVDRARAGDTATIRLDSAEAHIQILDSDQSQTGIEQEDGMADKQYKSVKLDGVDYDAEAKVVEALHLSTTRLDALQSELDALKGDKSKLEAERDVQKEKVDSLTTELETLKKSHVDSKEVEAKIQKRVALLDSANKFGVKVSAEMSDIDIMKAVVVAKAPNAKLDGRDDIYIQARFDSVLEDAVASEAGDASARAAGGSAPTDKNDGADACGIEKKKADYRKKLAGLSEGKKE